MCDTCIPSLIVINTTINQLETNTYILIIILSEAICFFCLFFLCVFYKKFMPISARGTTVAQANSECTLITTDYNKEVLKCDLNVESVGWFVILLDNEFHEDTVLGT